MVALNGGRFVPYTGATTNVDLGIYEITASTGSFNDYLQGGYGIFNVNDTGYTNIGINYIDPNGYLYVGGGIGVTLNGSTGEVTMGETLHMYDGANTAYGYMQFSDATYSFLDTTLNGAQIYAGDIYLTRGIYANAASQIYDSGSTQLYVGYSPSVRMTVYVDSSGNCQFDTTGTGFLFTKDIIVASAKNIVLNTVTGTKIGTGTTQKLGFWNATPIVKPATGGAAATFVANTSLIANDTATFDGYTIGQVVKALRNTGLLT